MTDSEPPRPHQARLPKCPPQPKMEGPKKTGAWDLEGVGLWWMVGVRRSFSLWPGKTVAWHPGRGTRQ